MNPSAVVELNRAVAVAMANGPGAGMAIIDDLERNGTLDGYYLFHAARADLLRRMGWLQEAHDHRKQKDQGEDGEQPGTPLR